MFNPEKITFADKFAIRLTNAMGTWSILGLECATIGALFLLIRNHDWMDICISIYTLLLDNVILIANTQQSKIQQSVMEYLVKLGETQGQTGTITIDFNKKLYSGIQQLLEYFKLTPLK